MTELAGVGMRMGGALGWWGEELVGRGMVEEGRHERKHQRR